MACTTEIQAAFILSSFMTFVGGLIILLAFRLILNFSKKCQTFRGTGIILELFSLRRIEHNPLRRLYFQRVFHNRIELLLSAQTVVGQVLAILVFVLSIGSLIIYFINSRDPVRECSSHQDKTIPVDLSFNVFFTFHFGLRFWAAEDKVKFWLEMNSIVDIFTIPPTFISYYLKTNWLGLRFLRALRLLELPKILQILKIIRTSNSVKLSKLLSIVISTWFTAAGFLHLVENSGDPWLNGRNSQSMSYFEAIYLVTATMSTVGFGDIVAKTALGRIFIVFFTLGSLILFANCVPEMVELFTSRKKYTKPYEAVKGKKFIVVCGNITVDSVTAFLRNFLRHKSGEINMDIVFLGEDPPSLELETLLKCSLSYTTFVCGSALTFEDLKRVSMEYAEACLILANPLCSDLQAEDNSNIMRVLSIKNYSSHTRVIIELLQSHNKGLLSKIPAWNWSTGDNIICFAELKLGFIAQGCLVPGLCTFLTTLFIEQNQKVFPKYPWQKYFLNSLKNKILTQRLSNDFVGMTFPAVSRLCFVKMHLMLIAVQHKAQFYSCCGLILNPPAQVKLSKDTLGFFIAESPQAVKRAFFYCSTCHKDVYNPELIGQCDCKNNQQQARGPDIVMMKGNNKKPTCNLENRDSVSREQESFLAILENRNGVYDNVEDTTELLDSSGMFHWCQSTPLDKVILKRSDKSKPVFRNHIVACVFGDAQSALIGLRNFVMPLRASNYTRQELKDIVFIGALEYFQREWRFLRNFPQIYIFPGSALYTGDLHEVSIEHCSMCAILASPYKPLSSQILVDTETITATLNIQALRISCPTPIPSVPGANSASSFSEYQERRYQQIPILTELKNPSNIHLIEQMGGMNGTLKGAKLHLSTSFARGTVFSDNFLDSLLATAFYNHHVLELLQMLVTGGNSAQMEQCLVQDKYYGIHEDSATIMSRRSRCKLGLLSLENTILSDIEPRKTFGQLFCGSLDNYGILCVGLYRVIDEKKQNLEHKRFVITRPANDCGLLPSDLVFCAIPFSTACYKTKNVSSNQILENITNVMSLAPEKHLSIEHVSKVGPEAEKSSQHSYTKVYPLDLFTSSFLDQ